MFTYDSRMPRVRICCVLLPLVHYPCPGMLQVATLDSGNLSEYHAAAPCTRITYTHWLTNGYEVLTLHAPNLPSKHRARQRVLWRLLDANTGTVQAEAWRSLIMRHCWIGCQQSHCSCEPVHEAKILKDIVLYKPGLGKVAIMDMSTLAVLRTFGAPLAPHPALGASPATFLQVLYLHIWHCCNCFLSMVKAATDQLHAISENFLIFLLKHAWIAKSLKSYEGSCLPFNVDSIFTTFLAFQSQLLIPT